jgi:hypothetical protein
MLWLDDYAEAVKTLIATDFYNLAKVPWLLAMWLRKLRFGAAWIELDPVVTRLEADVGRWRTIRLDRKSEQSGH